MALTLLFQEARGREFHETVLTLLLKYADALDSQKETLINFANLEKNMALLYENLITALLPNRFSC